jgi:hypothetical protein
VLGSLEELKTDDLWIGELQVSDIREIEWNTTALENLVLGESEKRLLTAIVASGIPPQHASFDDFIDGKGTKDVHPHHKRVTQI